MPWLGASLAGVLNLVVFTALCFLGLHCYVLCVLADAGSVPRDFEHDVEDVTSTYIQVLLFRESSLVRAGAVSATSAP